MVELCFVKIMGLGKNTFLVHGHDFGLEIWPFVGRRVSIFDVFFNIIIIISGLLLTQI